VSFKGLLLFSFLLTIAVSPAFAQYTGDDNDGSSVAAICVNTLDGVDQFSFGTLTGSSTFCDFSTEGYSIGINNPPQDIQYIWSIPSDATILSGNGTPNVTVAFGNTSGTVSVTVITPCVSQTFNMAVANGACSMYQGDTGDGFSQMALCTTTLDGAPLVSIAPSIVGSTNFCEGSTEGYSLQVDNAPADIYYSWSGPPGSVIQNGQGTGTAVIFFGSAPGNVTVDVITFCGTTTRSFAVTPMNCTMYAGGDNDGFSKSPSCSITLDGASQFSVVGIQGSSTFCEFGTEGYTVATINAPADTYYNWTVPADATIVTGQGTANITVLFGNTSGTVSVDLVTDCSTQSPAPFAVTSTVCSFYAGGDNDGFSSALNCASKLDGTNALIVSPITGSTTFCDFATESYTIPIQGASPETSFTWTVPAGASIVSGQGTTTVLIAFSNTGGNVSVDVTNLCGTVSKTLAVSTTNCQFYAGGNNDGFSMTPSCVQDLDGGDAFIPGPIVGSSSSCEFATETYSITVANAPINTTYVWSVPTGASIISGQGTTSVLVAFSNTSGNVSVQVSNDCTTKTVNLPITVASCIFYAGGNNDGFSMTPICTQNLDGGSAFIPGAIAGSSSFCSFSSESYSITVAGATATTAYLWSVPSGASIVSGQGTTTILVSFGNTSGNIAVAVSNECQTINVTLPVTGGSCVFYAGGNNDGFSVTTVSNIPLPVALVSFNAEVENNVVKLTWETSSEFENDFFLVERSKDGKTFERLTKVDGSGTTTTAMKYQATDPDPYHGTSYYRLSQTDYDGSMEYFRVISVKIETFYEVTRLYPNPVSKDAVLHVDYFAEEDGPVKISVIDPAGRSSEGQMVNAKQGVNLFEFAPHFQSSGVHVIIIRSRDKATALRLVVL